MDTEISGSTLPYAGTAQAPSFPAYAAIPEWCRISGMGRSKAYEALGAGHLRAVKLGVKTLIDVQHGLAWLGGLPQATIRPHGAKRTKQVA